MKPVIEDQPVDQPVILDMDPGVDDALAIVLAAHSPELRVTGICTVSGNVPVDLGTANSLKILEMMGRTDIAVYAGVERPLRRKPVHARTLHSGARDTSVTRIRTFSKTPLKRIGQIRRKRASKASITSIFGRLTTSILARAVRRQS